MAAGILKHADLIGAVAYEQERDAQEFDWLCITDFGNLGGNSKACPIGKKNGVLFFLKNTFVDVVGIGQTLGGFNRLTDNCKVGLVFVFGHRFRLHSCAVSCLA